MDGTLLQLQGYTKMTSNITVVMPCYKEDVNVVTKTYSDLVMSGFKVIVVDDGSNMDFPDEVNVITYPANVGYGYAIKQGIKAAQTDFIMTCDADGQHTSTDATKLATVFNLIDDCSMLVGCRWNLKEKPMRWIGRKMINFIASCWARHLLVDLNSGMRVFRKDLALSYSPILCDTFSFTTSLTMSMVTDNHKVAWFPIDVKPRAYGKSHVKVVKDGLITMFFVFWIGFALRTRKLRGWIRHLAGQ